jgi:hypothetical protein
VWISLPRLVTVMFVNTNGCNSVRAKSWWSRRCRRRRSSSSSSSVSWWSAAVSRLLPCKGPADKHRPEPGRSKEYELQCVRSPEVSLMRPPTPHILAAPAVVCLEWARPRWSLVLLLNAGRASIGCPPRG